MSTFQLPELEARPLSRPEARLADREPVVAQIDLAAERAAAVEAGRLEGFEQGLAEGQAQLASAIGALEAAVRQIAETRDALCDRVEPVAIDLALAGAEQIVGASLAVRPDLLKNTAAGALRRLVERDQVTILVHPDDLEMMREYSAELADQLGGIEMLEVQAERRVHAGGVIVTTPTGDIDARLDTRIDQLAVVVREALAR